MLEALFWAAVGLIVYTHVGYPLLLWLLSRVRRTRAVAPPAEREPALSLIVAARDEESVIADKVRNALALDYPRDRLQVIVASDGSTDATAERARAAGADTVLDLPSQGKVRTQDAGVDAATGEVLVFSDANTRLEPDAARRLVDALGEGIGYVCGHVHFTRGDAGGTNQEGAYWRYETAVRALESRLGSVTAGNGGLYATRRESYVRVDPRMGHDLSLPFNMVKRGWRAVYEPRARGAERMTPTNEEEYRRKRRMMSRTWLILLRGGILSPRGYGPLYLLQVVSHRLLRYLTPFLHLIALGTNIALLGHGWVYTVTLALQVALLAAAPLLARAIPWRPLQLARYYVLVTAAPAAGLWDSLRHPVSAGWEKAEGTR
ncbi:MAG TPA: glycosyltransferase family 2 protein [Thermoleophilaceae bacterium]|nr:glycosyltransferase family 2 protein [Thermoleophilaceae bacterium]